MSLNDKATAALKRKLVRAFPERSPNDAGHNKLARAIMRGTATHDAFARTCRMMEKVKSDRDARAAIAKAEGGAA